MLQKITRIKRSDFMKEIRIFKLRIIFGGYKPILFRKVKPPVDVHRANRRFERMFPRTRDWSGWDP